jgi:hypothetical protein
MLIVVAPSEEHIAFYLEIGMAITQWAHVEQALYSLCSLCVSPENMNPLFYGFFSIENFRSILSFTSRMLLAKYETDPRSKGMSELFERVMKCSTKRNKLVHRRVHGFMNEKPGRRYALLEWPKQHEKPPHNAVPGMAVRCPSSALCLREINAIRFEFSALFVTLTNLHLRLLGVKVAFAESDEQPKRPLPIQKLADQIRGVLGHSPKPSRRESLSVGIHPRGKMPQA